MNRIFNNNTTADFAPIQQQNGIQTLRQRYFWNILQTLRR
jgi:hypothetical protein